MRALTDSALPFVAITGSGITTCLGAGKGANWEALREGRSGLREVTRFELGDYPARKGGEAGLGDGDSSGRAVEEGASPGTRIPDEERQLLAVILEALEEAGLGRGALSEARVGLVIGSSLAGSSTADRFFHSYLERGPEGADFGLLEGYYVEKLLDRLCRELGVAGPGLLVSNACAAGGSSVATGSRWLRADRVDVSIVAGFDPLSVFTFAGFGSLMALSTTELRPLSAHRDGLLLGDGYAALVLESSDHAARRGRPPVGFVSGYGESTDAHHLTQPDPRGDGAALAMRRALAMAGVSPEEIGYINCHGTGTRANDLSEVRAMRSVFGTRLDSIPLSSSKPFFGHTLGGAGTVEAVVTSMALRYGFLPPTLNLDELDPELGEIDPLPTGRAASVERAMSNSFGFGGSNTSLVLSRGERAS